MSQTQILRNSVDEEDEEDEEVSEQIINERLVRHAIKAFSAFLYDIAFKKTSRTVEDLVQNKTSTVLFVTNIAATGGFFSIFVNSLLNLMCWKDSNGCRKALQIIQQPKVLHGCIEMFPQDLLSAVFTSLSDPYHKDSHTVLILLLSTTFQYVWTEKKNFDVASFDSILMKLLPPSFNVGEFKHRFVQEQTKKQRLLVKEFMHGITGVQVSQKYSTHGKKLLLVPEKNLIFKEKPIDGEDSVYDVSSLFE
jgi:hypothetical protein